MDSNKTKKKKKLLPHRTHIYPGLLIERLIRRIDSKSSRLCFTLCHCHANYGMVIPVHDILIA